MCEIVRASDGSGEVRVLMGGEEYSPIDIAAKILRKLKDDSELRLGQRVTHAVISVPAGFDHAQRAAVCDAGLRAGMQVTDILDRPTAAAIAHGFHLRNEETLLVLVFDFGSGLFEVTLLVSAGNYIAPLVTQGDIWVGGESFDRIIVGHVIEHVKSRYDMDVSKHPHFMAKLKQEAGKAKETLSSLDRGNIQIAGLLKETQNNCVDVDLEIKREQFEDMIRGRVDESMELVGTALKKVDLTHDQIDRVLLVGANCEIPLIRRTLEGIFGSKMVAGDFHPQFCVAFGAAIHGSVGCGAPIYYPEDVRWLPRPDKHKHDPQEDDPKLREIFVAVDKEVEEMLKN